MTVCLLQGYAADFGILFSLPLTATFLEKIVYNSCLYLPTLLTSNRQCWSPWNMASFATNGSCLWLRSPVSFRLPSGGRIFVLELPIALMNWTCSLFQTLIFSLLKMLLALVFFLQCTAFLQFLSHFSSYSPSFFRVSIHLKNMSLPWIVSLTHFALQFILLNLPSIHILLR